MAPFLGATVAVLMAERTPRQYFQRGTQMSFQGKQNEQPPQYGGTLRTAHGQKKTETGIGGKTRHIASAKQQYENGARGSNDENGKIQDGEPRAHGRPNRNLAIESNCVSKKAGADVCQQVDDAYGAEKFDANNADMVVQKVDEWLKHRSDSMSSIEFDNEIKTSVEDYEFNRLDADENYSATASLGEITQKNTRISDLFRCGPALVFSEVGGNPKVLPLDVSTLASHYVAKVQPPPVYCLYENANAATIFSQDEKMGKNQLKLACPALDTAKNDLTGSVDAFPVLHLTSKELPDGDVDIKTNLDFDSNKNIMLMTPQELERMPESGIEFEESVGPKEFEMLAQEEQMEVSEAGLVEQLQVSQEEDDDKCSLREVVADLNGVPASVSSTLATISISTDNDTNTTSIIINTKLGQREFKINTANLMQAAATLQPVTLADLVEQEEASVLPPEVSEEECSESCQNANCSGDAICGELLLPESLEKVPVKGCKREEKVPGSVICTHTGRCKKVWTCPEPYCGKVYTKQCKLKVHMMLHSGVRPYKCEVDGCDWAFTTLYKLKRHLETHCGAKDFVCDIEGCKRSFTTVYNLNSHKKLHDLPNSIACPIDNCHEHFPTRRKMELHMKEHSEIDAPYKCSIESCGKTYYTANSMASHLRVHQKANFRCTFDGCEKMFDKLSRFKVHMWHHTGERPYACSFEGCTWAFSSASKLKRHMRKHTGERKYPCKEPGCNKSFMRLEHLQGHLVTHRGDKPFVCPHENCDARFTAKSSLYVHLKKHGNSVEKVVYPCPIENCDKKYNCKSSLRIHMLRYHTPVLADAGQLDFVTLLSNEDLQDSTAIENYEPVIEQQNAISVTVQNDALETTLMSAQELLQSHAEHALSTSILPQQLEVATMIIGEIPSDNVQPSSRHFQATVCPSSSVSASKSEIEQLSTLCVLQQNNSGSARTDFCSNHMMMDRVRKRHQLQQDNQILCPTLESVVPLQDKAFAALASPQLTSNDVILTSTAVSFHNSTGTGIRFIQNQLLSDDPPPPHGDVYQEDGLLTSMANELSVPISLLAEPSGADTSGQTTDFGSSQSTVAEFTGTTINLQDLE